MVAAQRERDADALQRDAQGHLRGARDALGEDERDLLDAGAGEMRDLRRLDLERVARAEQLVEVDRGESVGAPELEAAAEVAERQPEGEARRAAADAAQREARRALAVG